MRVLNRLFILVVLFGNLSKTNGQNTSITFSNPLHPDYQTIPVREWEKNFDSFEFKDYKKGSHQLPYRFHIPEKMKRDQKYPLVLFMHGNGERGLDNRGQFERFPCVKFWERYPCYILAPQCPSKYGNIPNSELVWVDTPFDAKSHTMKSEPTWPMQLTIELLEKVIRENQIDSNRIYVTGLSMGGFATWELIQRETAKFAAAIPVCGGGDTAFASKLINIPLWVFHGEVDKTVLVDRSRNMVKAIINAGGKPKYTEYPGVRHDCWGLTYGNPEVWDWLFLQSKQ